MVHNRFDVLSITSKKERRPIGLLFLLEASHFTAPFPAIVSYAGGTIREERYVADRTEILVPSRGAPETTQDHLEYALKNEPLDLSAWHAIVSHLGRAPFVEWIKRVPTGRHSRRAWYLYEFLTGDRLPVEDMSQGNYVLLADSDLQFVSSGRNSPRHRVSDNLLGTRRFCPLIRKTERLKNQGASDLDRRARNVVAEIDPHDLARATAYLYHKETKASFLIEREDVSMTRMERFVAALGAVNQVRWYNERELVKLQNAIVEPRYAEAGYRKKQIYVGQTMPWGEEKVHYPCPRPEDVESLMRGWNECLLRTVRINPVCQAAVLGFGFVFIHPFEDGNGRLHRFVIHATLVRRQFTPENVVIPVSAVMLRRKDQYDAALESFSKPRLALIPFSLDFEGHMTVDSDTAPLYRYWDATAQCEYLYDALSEAVDVDLPDELRMLRAYDAGRAALLDIVDMPDRKADLLMRLLLQNGYRLSNKKREQFAEISDTELVAIENAVRDASLEPPDGAFQPKLLE